MNKNERIMYLLFFLSLFYLGCTRKTEEKTTNERKGTIGVFKTEIVDSALQSASDTMCSTSYFSDKELSKGLDIYIIDLNTGKVSKAKTGNSRDVRCEINSWVGTEITGIDDSIKYHKFMGLLRDSVRSVALFEPIFEANRGLIGRLDSLVKASPLYTVGTIFNYKDVRDTFADEPVVFAVPNSKNYYLVQYLGKSVQPIIMCWNGNVQEVNSGCGTNIENFIVVDSTTYVVILIGEPDTDNCAKVYYQIGDGIGVTNEFFKIQHLESEYIGNVIRPIKVKYELKKKEWY